MTIEQKALELVNAVRWERGLLARAALDARGFAIVKKEAV